MKKINSLFIYIIIFIVIYIFEYDFPNINTIFVSQTTIDKLNNTCFLDRIKENHIPKEYDYIFFDIKHIKSNIKKNQKDIFYKKDYNLICRDNGDCIKFIAKIENNNIDYVVFSSKLFYKNKMTLFKKQDRLFKSLFIKDINDTEVLIVDDDNITNQLKFFIFDVNKTKYKPKDINETII